jgi:hypothetical protein
MADILPIRSDTPARIYDVCGTLVLATSPSDAIDRAVLQWRARRELAANCRAALALRRRPDEALETGPAA